MELSLSGVRRLPFRAEFADLVPRESPRVASDDCRLQSAAKVAVEIISHERIDGRDHLAHVRLGEEQRLDLSDKPLALA
jgi:hypothetical protein